MKYKILTITMLGIIFVSTLNLALSRDLCPTCDGEGEIECPYCDGTGEIEEEETTCQKCEGTGEMTPKILMRNMEASQHDGATYVTGTFQNQENFEVNGTVTASLGGYSNSTSVSFPPKQDVTLTVVIDYVGSYSTLQLLQNVKLSVTGIEDISCPYCDGTGVALSTSTCPECDGEGTVECPTCDGIGYVADASSIEGQSGSSNLSIPTGVLEAVVSTAVVAGVALAAFLAVKKRRVNEDSLRRLSSTDFQNWVLSRVGGRTASSREISMGIDGFTLGGQPVLIKQSDDVGMTAFDSFASALARSKARNGVIVAFGFGSDAVRGRVRAKMNYGLDIQMLTVEELIRSKRML